MFLTLLFSFLIMLSSLTLFLNGISNYWRDRNVVYENLGFLLGPFRQCLLGKKNLGQLYKEVYDKHPEASYVGLVNFTQAFILVRDTELLKKVFTRDFASFTKNNTNADPKVDLFAANHMWFQDGEKWKKTRSLFTPLVANNNIKLYYPQMLEVNEAITRYLDQKINENGGHFELELKNFFSCYTTDIIAKTIFSLESNSFTNESSAFREITKTIFDKSWLSTVKFLLLFCFPKLATHLKIRRSSRFAEISLMKLTKDIMKQRAESGVKRKDFFQQMLFVQENKKDGEISDVFIASQAYAFLADGYETSSALISYLVFETAWHEDVQTKLREEIEDALRESNTKHVTFDQLHQLKYMDMVVNETLRLHSPVMMLGKVCTKRYEMPPQFPDSKELLTIEPGMLLTIPVMAIQKDPNYYPQPDRFNPENFTEESIASRPTFSFMAFGEGPRYCPGARIGLTQIKLAFATLIQHYRLLPSQKSKYKLPMDPIFPLKRPQHGAWVKVMPIKSRNINY